MPELNLSLNFYAQAFGMLSFALGILCFYQKNDRKLKLCMIALNLNHGIHYLLLEANTAALGALLSFVRTAVSLKSSSKIVAYAFIALVIIWGLYLSQSWYDLIPIVGACIGTYALFCMSGIPMRVAFLLGALCWLANNIIVGSIGGIMLELTLIAVNSTTIYRLTITAKEPQD